MKHFLASHVIKVVSQRDNGSGVIEIPIMATTTGDNDLITVELMNELVANFDSFALVPVGAEKHVDFNERGGIALAFIESIEMRGDMLFGRIDITASLFAEVSAGGWRGFSVEIAHNLKTQAKSIPGWVLTGGVFTNRPAVDAHFKIAASSRANSDSTGTFDVPIAPQNEGVVRSNMDTKQSPEGAQVSKSFHDEKIKSEQDKSVALEAARIETASQLELSIDENKRLRLAAEEAKSTSDNAVNDKLEAEAKSNRLSGENRGLKDINGALRSDITELESKLQTEAKSNLSVRVLAIRDAAIEAGVPPRMFDGIDADPAAWMTASWASVEAFEKHYTSLSGVSRDLVTEPVKSGKAPSKGSDDDNIDDEMKRRLRRLGLNPKFASIKTEDELIQMKAIAAEKKEG